MIYLILAGVIFLGLLYVVCSSISYTWGQALLRMGIILLVLVVVFVMALLAYIGLMQLQGGV